MAVGNGRKIWTTGEFLPDLPEAYYDYIAARGNLVAVNVERMALPKLDYFKKIYERGFRIATPINTHSGDADELIPLGIGLEDQKGAEPIHYNPVVLDFSLQKIGDWGERVEKSSVHNMKIDPSPRFGEPVLIALQNPQKEGSVVFRLDFSKSIPRRNLLLELEGVVDEKGNESMTFSTGESPESCSISARLTPKDFQTQPFYP